MEKYFLYYNAGGCNDGDHAYDLEEFDSEEEARQRFEEIQERDTEAYGAIVKGVRCATYN